MKQNHSEEGDGIRAVYILEVRVLGGLIHIHTIGLQGRQSLLRHTAGLRIQLRASLTQPAAAAAQM